MINVRTPEAQEVINLYPTEHQAAVTQQLEQIDVQTFQLMRQTLARQVEANRNNNENNNTPTNNNTPDGPVATLNPPPGSIGNPIDTIAEATSPQVVHSTYRGYARAAGTGALLGMSLPYLATTIPALTSIAAGTPTTLLGPGAATWATTSMVGLGGAGLGLLGGVIGRKLMPNRPLLGAAIGGLGGAGLGAGLSYGAATSWLGTVSATGALPYAVGALGVPAAMGAAGYYIGKLTGTSPRLGAAIGAGAGGLSYLALTGGAAAAAPVAATTAVAAGGLGALYGLGRLHRYIWNTDPSVGLLGTLARGALTPFSIPARIGTAFHEWAWERDGSDDSSDRIAGGILSPVTVPAGIAWNKLGLKHLWNGLIGGASDPDYQPTNIISGTASLPGRALHTVKDAAIGVTKLPGKAWNFAKWLVTPSSN